MIERYMPMPAADSNLPHGVSNAHEIFDEGRSCDECKHYREVNLEKGDRFFFVCINSGTLDGPGRVYEDDDACDDFEERK